jgi:hypothetical protein
MDVTGAWWPEYSLTMPALLKVRKAEGTEKRYAENEHIVTQNDGPYITTKKQRR